MLTTVLGKDPSVSGFVPVLGTPHPSSSPLPRRCKSDSALGLCLAEGWCAVTVGDFNALVAFLGLFRAFFCFESFLSCSCFCSRRPPEAGGESSNDVSGADPEICWWRLCLWTTATAVSQPTNQPTKSQFSL